MMRAIIDGLGLGVLLTFLIGPVFFLLIRTSLEKGAKQALILDVGVLSGDFLIIVLTFAGTARIFENPFYAKWLGITGAFVLIGFGVFPFIKRKSVSKEIDLLETQSNVILAFKGFLLNCTNPFVYFFWIGSVGYAVMTFHSDKMLISIYFISCLLCYLFFDLLKIYGAIRIKKILTQKMVSTINNGANIGIIILGIVLLVRILKQYA